MNKQFFNSTTSTRLTATTPFGDIAGTGGNKTATVTSNKGWSASTDATWLELTDEVGVLDGTFTITASSNGGNARAADINVVSGNKNLDLFINQAAGTPALTIVPSTKNLEALPDDFNVVVTSNTTWYVFADRDWIHWSGNSDTGNDTFEVNVDSNSGGERTGTLTVGWSGTNRTVTITQAGMH